MEEISQVFKPLRKIILTGNSLEPQKELFVLSHVNNFIATEKKNTREHKRKKGECTANNKVGDEETTENNASLALSRLQIEAAEMAVRDWEQSAAGLLQLIQEGKGQEILDSLIAASKLKEVSKRGIVLCLVILIKKSSDVNIVTRGYSAVPQICTSSNLFLLFIELCKIYTAASTKNSGWGRGMRRAIRCWYLQWEPQLLALEVTRHPSAYTWSHRDVLKMAHIGLKDLPKETQAVLHFLFAGFESTNQKFSSEENAKEILQHLKILQKVSEENDETISEGRIERLKNILSKFGSISIHDFPSHSINDAKVMMFFVENCSAMALIDALATTSLFRLIHSNAELRSLLSNRLQKEGLDHEIDLLDTVISYNNCRRICTSLLKDEATRTPETPKSSREWMRNVAPDPDKTKKPRLPLPRPKEDDDLFAAIARLLTQRTTTVTKLKRKPLIFVDLESYIDGFIAVTPENPGAKEIRGTQAASLLVLALAPSHSGLETALPLLAPKLKKGDESSPDYTFTSLQSGLSKLAKTSTERLKVTECLKLAFESAPSTCLLIYWRLTKEVMTDIHETFKRLTNENASAQVKVVACGVDWVSGSDVTPFTHPDLLFLFGFNRHTLPTIQTFDGGFL